MNWFLIVLTIGFWWNNKEELWIVQRESEVAIQGSSNIGDYWCKLNTIELADTIHLFRSGDDLKSLSNSALSLPVKKFKCANFLMNKDFQDLLKAEKYKSISVQLSQLENPGSARVKALDGKIKLTITGVTREYPMRFQYSRMNNGDFILSGETEVALKDFKLSAPSRLGGLIKFDETVDVSFKLNFSRATMI